MNFISTRFCFLLALEERFQQPIGSRLLVVEERRQVERRRVERTEERRRLARGHKRLEEKRRPKANDIFGRFYLSWVVGLSLAGSDRGSGHRISRVHRSGCDKILFNF